MHRWKENLDIDDYDNDNNYPDDYKDNASAFLSFSSVWPLFWLFKWVEFVMDLFYKISKKMEKSTNNVIIKNEKYYIRFKNIPENEISGVYDGDLGKIRDEVGVCVFDCIIIDGFYKIILPSFSTCPLYDLQNFINYTKPPIYLVTGDEVGKGTYGEPAIKNVKIISELDFKELYNPVPFFKLDPTNVQLIKKI